VLNEAWGKNRDKKLWVGLFLFSFLSVVGQKLNLSWVGLRVARFSVCPLNGLLNINPSLSR
jgi:hypothetical protein